MDIDRRSFIGASAALGAAVAADTAVAQGGSPRPRRIATEEAFASPDQAQALLNLAKGDWPSPDLSLWRSFTRPEMASRSRLYRGLLDLEGDRIRDMDENGVDVQILSLTSPGVQIFNADTGTGLAATANDQLAETIGRHPTRFAGLAAFAPQDSARAAKEMERGINQLGLNGFILNSHTNNEYMDDRKFWPVFEAAQALNRPLYIHPRCPSEPMWDVSQDYGLSSGMWGFHSETSLHVTRMILAGVFDQFPKLQIVLGHMGEGLPYWLYRIDHVYQALNPVGSVGRLKASPQEVFARNFSITTSGVNDPKVLAYVIAALGVDKVMWAIDYPYESSKPAVEFMDQAPISAADREKVYQINAERIFSLRT